MRTLWGMVQRALHRQRTLRTVTLWVNTYPTHFYCEDGHPIIRAVAYHATRAGVCTVAEHLTCGECENDHDV